MSNPEVRKWNEEGRLGSAQTFGEVLQALRANHSKDPQVWASTAGIEEDRYLRLERAEEELPPLLEELDNWSRGWSLTRDEIIHLKQFGGYDVSAYGETSTFLEELYSDQRSLKETMSGLTIFEKAIGYTFFGIAHARNYYMGIRSRLKK